MHIKTNEGKRNYYLSRNIFFVLLFGIWIIGCTFRSNHPDIARYIQTVPYASSSEDINIDVITDTDNVLHLVWQSKEEGIKHQMSSDSGKSWSEPVSIDSALSNLSSAEGPRIFDYKNIVHIFWRRQGFNLLTSFDHGKSWINKSTKLFEKLSIANYEIMADDHVIYFAYNNREGLFLLRSDDFGFNWTDPKQITSFGSIQPALASPSIAIYNNMVYLLWSQMDTQSSISGFYPSKLFVAHSQDHGKTWSAPSAIATDNLRRKGTFLPIRKSQDKRNSTTGIYFAVPVS
jgi:hypothetical protein